MADKKALGVVLLVGAAAGGLLLWQLSKKDELAVGFVISKISIEQEGEPVQFPQPWEEFDVKIIAMNNTEENAEGYCDIVDTDSQQTVFSETLTNIEPRGLRTFIYTTTMPATILNLDIRTGRVIDTEKVQESSHPLQMIAQIINVLGVGVSPATVSPGEDVVGSIGTQNDYASQTVDVFWAYGTFNPGTGEFSIAGYWIDENITFLGQSSYMYQTPALIVPDTPGTWDLMGVLADDIYVDGENIAFVRQHGPGAIEEKAFTISGVSGEIQITSVSVGSG